MQYVSVMAIGKPGGCKSTAIAQMLYAFARYGVTPELVSDRLLLESAVVEDTKNGVRRSDGAIEGAHSILFDGTKPPGLKVFEVKDGTLLNRVHDVMVRYAGTHRNPHGVLLEFATGPDVPLPIEPLLQSGESFMERFRKNGILPDHHVVVAEIEASLEERRRRNGRRVDGMKEETFLKYFPDGGELRESGYRLTEFGVQFVWIDNDHDDLSRFLRDTREFCDIHLRPLIEGNLGHIEGAGIGSLEDRWGGLTPESEAIGKYGPGRITPPRLIFITGLPASGKSIASREITQLLEDHGVRTTFRTDKEMLEKEVRRDIDRFLQDPARRLIGGGVEGEHSLVHNPDGDEGTLQIVFKDGNALNSAHKNLLDEARAFLEKHDDGVFVIEWAYGKNVPYEGEELTHDGSQLVRWLADAHLLDNVMVVDIVSSEQDREERNKRRPGHIPTDEFTLYFKEEGHFTPEDIVQLDSRYRRIDNVGTNTESYGTFLESIRGEFASFIAPNIEGHHVVNTEGHAFLANERMAP